MPKSLAQEQFELKHATEMEIATRELQRRSLDTIRVYNPLDHTFSFMYDRFWHRTPAKSYKDFPRYLAMKFFKNICDYMIGQQITLKGNELKALREKQMGQQFLDHYEENVQIWDKTPKINDPDLIAQIKKTVLIGVVEEYGAEEPDQEMPVPEQKFDNRSVHEQMFDSLSVLSADSELPASMDELQGKTSPQPVIEQTVDISKAELEKEVISEV